MARRHGIALAVALSLPPAPLLAAEMFGDSYKPCGDQPTTVAIVACVGAKTKLWDGRLNTAYSALQKRVEPAQRGPLSAAQRLWVQFRDANCGFYGAEDGTIRQIKSAECLRSMTRDRALELEQEMQP